MLSATPPVLPCGTRQFVRVRHEKNADKIEETYIAYLEGLVTSIENDKFNIDSTQYAVENLLDVNTVPINITRQESVVGSWNGTLSHVFKITFASLLTSLSPQDFANASLAQSVRATDC